MKGFGQVENVEKAEVDEKNLIFYTQMIKSSYFMDNVSFEQVSMLNNIIGDSTNVERKFRSCNFAFRR